MQLARVVSLHTVHGWQRWSRPLENCPCGHVMQTVSRVLLQARNWPFPGRHSEQVRHVLPSEYMPLLRHAAHFVSCVTSQLLFSYFPAGHWRHGWQIPVELSQKCPGSHCTQILSADAVHSCITALPGGHWLHGVQELPPPVEKEPAGHAKQVVLATAEQDVNISYPEGHTAQARQTVMLPS